GESSHISRVVCLALTEPVRWKVTCVNVESAREDMDSFCGLAGDWAADLLPVERAAQQTASRRRHRSDRTYYPAADQDVSGRDHSVPTAVVQTEFAALRPLTVAK